MSQYIDGFLVPVPAEHIEAYARMSSKAGAIWKAHGALDYRECVGDDLDVPDMTSFRQSAGAKDGELVVFAWILYPSKEDRDRINAAVMADPRLNCEEAKGMFDFRRMACGGFRSIVHV
ncbi:RNA signal recognition particle 4.5S RNA [plant metagenome]|uniref:RNA signal recognition particle 4.5S RNA n=2 Tax=root TaxID=1 RepID=A0A1C3K4Z6_9BURK|nr:DUF1428 domain-containing protein [Orrella dioscoreae]SBT26498.1 RNA signal recognition particle 4.5S RNA [Orrella dioscoreae]SOE46800.1 RNA signal recognition particle 4.5S RNA [Orrella dioscoreae]